MVRAKLDFAITTNFAVTGLACESNAIIRNLGIDHDPNVHPGYSEIP
jgi:hypothetical protein